MKGNRTKPAKWEALFPDLKLQLAGKSAAWLDEILAECRSRNAPRPVALKSLVYALTVLGWSRRLTVYSANAPRERWGRELY